MSASGTRERLQTVEGVMAEASRIDIELSPEQARRCLVPRGAVTNDCRWMNNPNAVSTGPLVYLRNRLRELDCAFGRGLAEDDSLPLTFRTKGRKLVLDICDVARSKMFRTPLVVYPIDITAMRVTVG